MPRAPRQCPGNNGACPNRIRNTRHCHEHTCSGWNDPNNRTASSKHTGTRAFQRLAATIKQRDNHQCQIRLEGICTAYADTVDHIIPVAERPDLADEPTNLRAACRSCNENLGRLTARRNASRRGIQRAPEQHPGLIR